MSRQDMQQRCRQHDYCEPCFYMITLVTSPRRDCLSELTSAAEGCCRHRTGGCCRHRTGLLSTPDRAAEGTEPPRPVPTPAGVIPAKVTLSPVGTIVLEVWQRTTAIYPEVEACECVVMPDHFHGILRVKTRLKRHVGHIIKAFKEVSAKECRQQNLLLPSPSAAGPVSAAAPAGSVSAAAPAADLWQEGYQDSILLHRGQLRTMVNYISDNPTRLATRLANPELFTVVAHRQILPGRGCAMIGNHFLLGHPLKRSIQISRRVPDKELAAQKAEMLYAAQHGAVLVSPCISPGEQDVARAIMAAGKPLIVLLGHGFPASYKPPGRYFEACAQGRLLMLAPFPYRGRRGTLTREQCLTLNKFAQEIASG